MTNPHTTQEVLGFHSIVVAAHDTGVDHPGRILRGVNAAAEDLGIKINQPSDELDLSRDLIIDEAVGNQGKWRVIDDVLYVGFDGIAPEDVRLLDQEEES